MVLMKRIQECKRFNRVYYEDDEDVDEWNKDGRRVLDLILISNSQSLDNRSISTKIPSVSISALLLERRWDEFSTRMAHVRSQTKVLYSLRLALNI